MVQLRLKVRKANLEAQKEAEENGEPSNERKLIVMGALRELENFSKQLHTHPLFRYRLVTCIIDVFGGSGETGCPCCKVDLNADILDDPKKMEAIIQKFGNQVAQQLFGQVGQFVENPSDFMAKQGALAMQVKKIITGAGFKITCQGAGNLGWHIGCACADKEGDRLCDILHWQFQRAIRDELLAVTRHYYQPTFPHLWSDQDILAWVAKNGGIRGTDAEP